MWKSISLMASCTSSSSIILLTISRRSSMTLVSSSSWLDCSLVALLYVVSYIVHTSSLSFIYYNLLTIKTEWKPTSRMGGGQGARDSVAVRCLYWFLLVLISLFTLLNTCKLPTLSTRSCQYHIKVSIFTVPELSDGRTYTDLIRTALLQRYSIIRYIYSCFHSIGEYGGAFFKPLYYEFEEDVTTFDDNSTQRNILLGDALKLSI